MSNVLHDQVMEWLAFGERGSSSETMAFTFLGRGAPRWSSAPSDPDDLRRCLLLLQAAPEARKHMDKLRSLSKTWERLVDRWDDLEGTFLSETGGTLKPPFGTRCHKTYSLMKEIIGDRRAPGLHIEFPSQVLDSTNTPGGPNRG